MARAHSAAVGKPNIVTFLIDDMDLERIPYYTHASTLELQSSFVCTCEKWRLPHGSKLHVFGTTH